jgi:hypothetical protein
MERMRRRSEGEQVPTWRALFAISLASSAFLRVPSQAHEREGRKRYALQFAIDEICAELEDGVSVDREVFRERNLGNCQQEAWGGGGKTFVLSRVLKARDGNRSGPPYKPIALRKEER